MNVLDGLFGLFGLRIVPDRRMKRFKTEEKAIKFLCDHNKMSYLWDDSIWNDMKDRPEDDIFTAYEEVCYEHECAE